MARERGSVTVWVAGVTMLATVLALVLARTAVAGAASGRAQAVADLAALAGVDGRRPAAAAVAGDNHSTMVSYAESDGRVDVTVRRDGVAATASAEPGELPTGEGQHLHSGGGVQSP
jgi:hypothetical protein